MISDSGRAQKKLLADGGLLLAAIFWGIGFVAMKEALQTVPIFWLLAIRFVTAFFVIALIFRKKILNIKFQEIKAGVFTGIILLCAFAGQFSALKYTEAGKLAFITSTYVVMVPWLYWKIKKVFPGFKTVIASFICIMGLYLVTFKGNFMIEKGDIIGLVSAFFFAVHIIAVEYYVSKLDPFIMTVTQMGAIGFISLPVASFFEAWPAEITISGFWSVLYAILFCTIFAYIIQNVAQKHTTSTSTSIMLSFVSVAGVLSGIVLLGEKFTAGMIAGFFLIFLSVIISELPLEKIRCRMLKKAV